LKGLEGSIGLFDEAIERLKADQQSLDAKIDPDIVNEEESQITGYHYFGGKRSNQYKTNSDGQNGKGELAGLSLTKARQYFNYCKELVDYLNDETALEEKRCDLENKKQILSAQIEQQSHRLGPIFGQLEDVSKSPILVPLNELGTSQASQKDIEKYLSYGGKNDYLESDAIKYPEDRPMQGTVAEQLLQLRKIQNSVGINHYDANGNVIFNQDLINYQRELVTGLLDKEVFNKLSEKQQMMVLREIFASYSDVPDMDNLSASFSNEKAEIENLLKARFTELVEKSIEDRGLEEGLAHINNTYIAEITDVMHGARFSESGTDKVFTMKNTPYDKKLYTELGLIMKQVAQEKAISVEKAHNLLNYIRQRPSGEKSQEIKQKLEEENPLNDIRQRPAGEESKEVKQKLEEEKQPQPAKPVNREDLLEFLNSRAKEENSFGYMGGRRLPLDEEIEALARYLDLIFQDFG
jgi:hypothetical protein